MTSSFCQVFHLNLVLNLIAHGNPTDFCLNEKLPKIQPYEKLVGKVMKIVKWSHHIPESIVKIIYLYHIISLLRKIKWIVNCFTSCPLSQCLCTLHNLWSNILAKLLISELSTKTSAYNATACGIRWWL